jgi:AraC-like DNA-binding protein
MPMNSSNAVLFFISTLGWFNGLILSLYFLFFIKNNTLSNSLLGFLLLCLSLRISKSVVWYFNPKLPVIFIQLGLCVCLFIGPLLIIYIRKALQQSKSLNKYELGLLIFTAIAAITMILFYADDLNLWKKYFIVSIYAQWFLCVIIAGFPLINIFKNLRKQGLKLFHKWILIVYLSNLAVVTFYIISYFKIFSLAYISGAIAFSFILYFNFLIIFYRKKTGDLFQIEKYQNKRFEEPKAQVLIQKLHETIQKQEIYTDSNLKLNDLAMHMGIPPHQLSQLLNDNIQQSFAEFLAEFRIKKSCELISSGSNLKIEAIGYEVGFQSKSTFFAAFKKITGTTPSLFKETAIIS